jgi:hypothetical protein
LRVLLKASLIALCAVTVVAAIGLVGVLVVQPAIIQRQLYDGRLQAADYWAPEPEILSAGLGFTNIVGLSALNEQSVRDADGAWESNLTCRNGKQPDSNQRTSASLSSSVSRSFRIRSGATFDHDDGLPVVFSWPVRSNTIDPTGFQFTLNTGRTVVPDAAGIVPNWELNERNVVVVFGKFGNRGLPGETGAEYPVRLDILPAGSPLMLAGPSGDRSAVGLSWSTERSGYAAGPTLVGAKLNRVDGPPRGEGGVAFIGNDTMPNDEVTLYGDKARFRLRTLTTGGFSPDGVLGVRPNDFERFFRLHAVGSDGSDVILDKAGVDYSVMGGTLRVLGLSDLGKKEDQANGVIYDDCYREDHDNYIDVILAGDDAAAGHLTAPEMPGTQGNHGALYNPGGPGATPFEGVRYTAPSPPVIQTILIALDDPMRVSR